MNYTSLVSLLKLHYTHLNLLLSGNILFRADIIAYKESTKSLKNTVRQTNQNHSCRTDSICEILAAIQLIIFCLRIPEFEIYIIVSLSVVLYPFESHCHPTGRIQTEVTGK